MVASWAEDTQEDVEGWMNGGMGFSSQLALHETAGRVFDNLAEDQLGNDGKESCCPQLDQQASFLDPLAEY